MSDIVWFWYDLRICVNWNTFSFNFYSLFVVCANASQQFSLSRSNYLVMKLLTNSSSPRPTLLFVCTITLTISGTLLCSGTGTLMGRRLISQQTNSFFFAFFYCSLSLNLITLVHWLVGSLNWKLIISVRCCLLWFAAGSAFLAHLSCTEVIAFIRSVLFVAGTSIGECRSQTFEESHRSSAGFWFGHTRWNGGIFDLLLMVMQWHFVECGFDACLVQIARIVDLQKLEFSSLDFIESVIWFESTFIPFSLSSWRIALSSWSPPCLVHLRLLWRIIGRIQLVLFRDLFTRIILFLACRKGFLLLIHILFRARWRIHIAALLSEKKIMIFIEIDWIEAKWRRCIQWIMFSSSSSSCPTCLTGNGAWIEARFACIFLYLQRRAWCFSQYNCSHNGQQTKAHQ